VNHFDERPERLARTAARARPTPAVPAFGALVVCLGLAVASDAGAGGRLGDLLGGGGTDAAGTLPGFEGPEILPVDEAFVFSAEPDATGALVVRWDVRPGYYLYRDRIAVAKTDGAPADAELATGDLPPGDPKDDPIFGRVRIFDEPVALEVTATGAPEGLDVIVRYQGCAEVGVCYPPQTRTVYLPAPPASRGTSE